jgi:DNA mismatch repair protein MutL
MAVERAVRDALSPGGRPPKTADAGRVREATAAYLAAATAAYAAGAEAARVAEDGARVAERPAGARLASEAPFGPPSARPTTSAAGGLFAAGPATVLGQHRNTYIVASDGVDLILVDQHTAHERVRFEALLDGASRSAAPSQLLLAPAVVDVAPDLEAVLEGQVEHLRALGFDLEAFGRGSLRLRATPAVLGARDPGPALVAILRDLLERESSQWAVGEQRERVAATVACHSAVRADQPLSTEAMAAIVDGLGRTAHPDRCPHGRPTTARIPRDEVSRRFGRTGWRRQ